MTNGSTKTTLTDAIMRIDEHANNMDDCPLQVRVATSEGYLRILSVYEAYGDLVIDVDASEVIEYED